MFFPVEFAEKQEDQKVLEFVLFFKTTDTLSMLYSLNMSALTQFVPKTGQKRDEEHEMVSLSFSLKCFICKFSFL